MASLSLESKLEVLVQGDRRFTLEAFQFVFESLDFVLAHPGCRKSGTSRHITVRELLEGMRRMGLEQFGPLARCVFESWGVFSTADFGEIVFSLIEHDLLHQGESDRKEDFVNAFDFRAEFDEGYRPTLNLTERA